MNPRPRVALLIETSSAYARELIRGVSTHMQRGQPWAVSLREGDRPDPSWLSHHAFDGIIARFHDEAIVEAVRATGLPAVSVSGTTLAPEHPRVDTDNDALCAMVANELLARGYEHFAYVGAKSMEWSNWRHDLFQKAIASHGHTLLSCDTPLESEDSVAAQTTLAAWLTGLPKPIAILACNDAGGRLVLDACAQAGISVPEDAAVIGIDDDELICELCVPPLSSVAENTERIGEVAAELLDRMMRGEKVPAETTLIKPLGITTRRSTDAAAVPDRLVARALRWIRDHAVEDINVESVVRELGSSRRALEERFRATTGRTPHGEIARVRLESAQRMLTTTDLPMHAIAERSGFKRTEYMSSVFKKKLGIPPGEYRKRFRD